MSDEFKTWVRERFACEADENDEWHRDMWLGWQGCLETREAPLKSGGISQGLFDD